MSYSETITRTDLLNILNEVLPSGGFSVGDYTGITSFPWTAPYDCVVQARVYPASTANSYISFNLNDGRVFNLTAVNGTALSGEILVKKGTVLSNYQYSNLAPNASYIGYIPIYHTMSGDGSKTLLWTNPNPTSAMSAQQLIASGADSYDEIQVVYKTAHIYNGWQTQTAPFVSGAHITLFAPSGANGEFSGAIVNAVRTITMSSGGKLTADNAGTFSTSSFSTNNNMCIPVYIYGIKH